MRRILFIPGRALPLPPSVVTASLPNATQGVAYNTSLAALGGLAPLTWSIISGTLSPGLTLSPLGIISGTPTTIATDTFTVRVLDSLGRTAQRVLSITVASVTDTTPPTAPVISAVGVSSGTVNVSLDTPSTDTSGIASYRLERSLDGSTGWVVVDAALVPANFPYSDTGRAASTTYFYRQRATDNAGNVGPYSAVVSGTTQAAAGGPGTTGPIAEGATAQILGGFTTDAPIILGWDNFEGRADGAAIGSMAIQNAPFEANDFVVSSVAPYAGTRCAFSPNTVPNNASNGTRLGFNLGGFRRRIYASYRYKWVRGTYLDSHLCVNKWLQIHGTEPNGQSVGNFAPGVFISGANTVANLINASGADTAQVSQDVSPFGDFWNSSGRGIFNDSGWRMPFDTWHHFEYILTQSSAPGVADGRFVVRYNGVQRLDTGLIVTRASADRVWSYVNCPAGNQRQNDNAIKNPCYVDIYHQQDGHGRVYLTNAPTWAASTIFEPQPCLSDSTYRVSLGGLAALGSGANVYEYRTTNASPYVPVSTTGATRVIA